MIIHKSLVSLIYLIICISSFYILDFVGISLGFKSINFYTNIPLINLLIPLSTFLFIKEINFKNALVIALTSLLLASGDLFTIIIVSTCLITSSVNKNKVILPMVSLVLLFVNLFFSQINELIAVLALIGYGVALFEASSEYRFPIIIAFLYMLNAVDSRIDIDLIFLFMNIILILFNSGFKKQIQVSHYNRLLLITISTIIYLILDKTLSTYSPLLLVLFIGQQDIANKFENDLYRSPVLFLIGIVFLGVLNQLSGFILIPFFISWALFIFILINLIFENRISAKGFIILTAIILVSIGELSFKGLIG